MGRLRGWGGRTTVTTLQSSGGSQTARRRRDGAWPDGAAAAGRCCCLFGRDATEAGHWQVDVLPFAGQCLSCWRVQRGLLKKLLGGGIAHVWLAFSCPNGAPLKFHNLGVEGWVQLCF